MNSTLSNQALTKLVSVFFLPIFIGSQILLKTIKAVQAVTDILCFVALSSCTKCEEGLMKFKYVHNSNIYQKSYKSPIFK